MEYHGKPFKGIEAFCHLRSEKRIFRIDRILEIKEV
jgi:predicted DNA-binding transcriptional regulator YafY